MTAPIATDDYLKGVSYRRTIYGLNNKSPVSDERILEIIKAVAITSPSSYNTQPGRFTVLLGAQHRKLWDIVSEIALPIVTQHAGEAAAKGLGGQFGAFKAAYGSVLFWEDNAVVKKAGETHAAVAHLFPQFSEHSDAMAQVQIWTALELEGFGANLQHMGAGFPPAEEAIRKEWNIPAEWSLKANMNFGGLAQDRPARPDKLPIDETVKVFKS